MTGGLEDPINKLPRLSEEELLRIATVESDQYLPHAVALVREELARRGVSEGSRERYQQLRSDRERRETAAERKGQRWLAWAYPNINDRASAIRASRQGVIAAVIVSAITAVLALLAGRSERVATVPGIDAYALIDAVLFAIVAFGMWRHSRVAAVSGVVLFVGEKLYLWAAVGHRPGGVAALLFLGFVNGVRGTFAYYRSSPAASGCPRETVDPS